MKQIALIGYSGHSYVIADAIIENNYTLVGYFELEETPSNPFKLEYLGKDEEISDQNICYFPAIGSNRIREQIFKLINKKKVETINVIHPTASISSFSKIGIGNFIAASVRINPLSIITNGCIINTGAIIEHECYIGEFSHVAPGAVLTGNVKIGKSSFIGANSVIKQGVTIGENVIIGAGTVVLKDIPDNQTWVGNPAKRIK